MEKATAVRLETPGHLLGSTIDASTLQELLNYNLEQGVITGSNWTFMYHDASVFAIRIE